MEAAPEFNFGPMLSLAQQLAGEHADDVAQAMAKCGGCNIL
jgi:hypothetical protein